MAGSHLRSRQCPGDRRPGRAHRDRRAQAQSRPVGAGAGAEGLRAGGGSKIKPQGTITVNVSNGAGKWIDLIVESVYPTWAQIWKTGHIDNGSRVSWSDPLTFHVNKSIKVTRWAPGAFGIAGNGGGEFFFVVPDDGDAVIDISVIG